MTVSRPAVASVVVLLLVVSAASSLLANELPDILFFHSEHCTDCQQMDEVLDELLELYPEVYVDYVEETEPGASDLMWTLSAEYGIFPTNYPVIFAGDQVIVGSGRDKELRLRAAVRTCALQGCQSPMSRLERDPFPLTTIAIMAVVLLTAALLLFL